MTRNPRPYDFRKPPGLSRDAEGRLVHWFRALGTLAPPRWAKYLAYPAAAGYRGAQAFRAADALPRLPEGAVGHRVGIDPGAWDSLLLLPRPLLLALAGGMVGEAFTGLPADREMTTVEDSLAEYFLQNLLLDLLQQTCPGGPVGLRLGGVEPHPQWSRLLPADAPVLLCDFELSGHFGAVTWHWLLPLPAAAALAGGEAAPASGPAGDGPGLESLVRKMPVDFVVELGTVELSVAQVAALAAGDLLVLGQRTAEPLTARVAGEKKVQGWPCRVGPRQAFLTEVMEE